MCLSPLFCGDIGAWDRHCHSFGANLHMDVFLQKQYIFYVTGQWWMKTANNGRVLA